MPSLPAIDFESFRFASPVYLWLLLIPAALMVVWAWRLVRRRANVRRLAAQRIVPVRQRFGPIGDLAFWACVLIASLRSALRRLRVRSAALVVPQASADIVILQDASASMYVPMWLPIAGAAPSSSCARFPKHSAGRATASRWPCSPSSPPHRSG